MKTTLALCFGSISAACASEIVIPDLPVSVSCQEGLVRASTEEDARRLAALLDELAPKVRELLGEARIEPAEVILMKRGLPPCCGACNYGSMILMDESTRGHERIYLAHELVHWQCAGSLMRLPNTVREGLADEIGVRLAPEECMPLAIGYVTAFGRGTLSDPVAALNVPKDKLWDSEFDSSRTELYAVGYFVASKIGLDGLRALCSRAEREGRDQVPAEWFLDEAHLSTKDIRQWDVRFDCSLPPGTTKITLRTSAGDSAPSANK
jgi:hypothetical protein